MAMIEISGLALAGRLHDISLALPAGKMLGVIGPNGSGKSTLLHCLAGLLPCQGQVCLDGQNLADLPPRQRAQRVALLPQEGESAWALTVEDVVALGRLPWGDGDCAAVDAAMRQTGVDPLRGRRIDRLSGGERARVWLARVFAGQPALLLADEPIASLDLRHQKNVMDALRRYADAGHGVILVIHDFSLAARYCDRLCMLDGGRLHACGAPPEEHTESHMSAVFQTPMLVNLSADPPIILPR